MENILIYFLRHGQTASSKDNLFCGANSNPELTADGHEMAQLFAEAYGNMPWQGIYCSPLLRCQLTLQPLLKHVTLKPQIRDGLKEIDYGQWEGQTLQEIKKIFPETYLQWSADPAFHAPTKGESAFDIASRAMAVIEEIRVHHTKGPVLIVSHKATIRVMLCALLGIDLGRFRHRLACPVASLSVVELTANGPLLHKLADRAHLTQRLIDLPGT